MHTHTPVITFMCRTELLFKKPQSRKGVKIKLLPPITEKYMFKLIMGETGQVFHFINPYQH